MRKRDKEYSPERIKKALDQLEFSGIEVKGGIFCIISKVEGLAGKILMIFKIIIPSPMTRPNDFGKATLAHHTMVCSANL